LGGNDWFVIPVELNVGSLYRTRSLVITDTFGIRTLIKSSSELGALYSTWRMFQHSDRGLLAAAPAAHPANCSSGTSAAFKAPGQMIGCAYWMVFPMTYCLKCLWPLATSEWQDIELVSVSQPLC
jgi:hypothetical protein